MKAKVIDKREDLDFPVTLLQTSRGRYTVVYGKEIRTGLDYDTAAVAYGHSVMHALACAGKLEE